MTLHTIQEAHDSRAELAMTAVTQERLRVARDLHDLLGYSLSAIILKSELTHRLIARHPAQAEHEISETMTIARQALADVRAVAEGYHELSFDVECRSARSVLTAAGIALDLDVPDALDLPIQISTVFAVVLREGVTNLLRHSKAGRCRITLDRSSGAVRLELVNDGVRAVPRPTEVPVDPPRLRAGGNGIENLRMRMAAMGGTVDAGPEPDGRYRLAVAAPLRAA